MSDDLHHLSRFMDSYNPHDNYARETFRRDLTRGIRDGIVQSKPYEERIKWAKGEFKGAWFAIVGFVWMIILCGFGQSFVQKIGQERFDLICFYGTQVVFGGVLLAAFLTPFYWVWKWWRDR